MLKSARYVDGVERVEFGEIHAFVGKDFLITLRYGGDFALDEVRRQIEDEPCRLRRGPIAVFCEILRRIVEGYAPAVEGLESDMDEIEAKVFGGEATVSPRIHGLSREVVRLHQATKPLVGVLERFAESGVSDPEARRYVRRAQDRVLRATERIEGLRDLLSSILGVNLTMVGIEQNNQMQKLSAWGAILIIPTLIAGIFGMNFEGAGRWAQLKYLDYGFEITVAAMFLISLLLYLAFKRAGYL